MPRHDFSPEARADLLTLSIYITEQSGALRAERVLMRIQRAIDTLASMPRLGRSQPYLESGTLSFPVTPWVIIYEPLSDVKGILVVRIVDGRRDLHALFDDQE